MSKFIFKSLPQLIVVVGLLVSSTQAHASGGPSDPVPQFVNLLILIGIITFVYQSKIKPVLVARAEQIKSELEKGQKELSIAEAHAEEHAEREAEDQVRGHTSVQQPARLSRSGLATCRLWAPCHEGGARRAGGCPGATTCLLVDGCHVAHGECLLQQGKKKL